MNICQEADFPFSDTESPVDWGKMKVDSHCIAHGFISGLIEFYFKKFSYSGSLKRETCQKQVPEQRFSLSFTFFDSRTVRTIFQNQISGQVIISFFILDFKVIFFIFTSKYSKSTQFRFKIRYVFPPITSLYLACKIRFLVTSKEEGGRGLGGTLLFDQAFCNQG